MSKFFEMLFSDSIVAISVFGLAIVLGICAFYVYYFWKNIEES